MNPVADLIDGRKVRLCSFTPLGLAHNRAHFRRNPAAHVSSEYHIRRRARNCQRGGASVFCGVFKRNPCRHTAQAEEKSPPPQLDNFTVITSL
jgi:hypothetical protein